MSWGKQKRQLVRRSAPERKGVGADAQRVLLKATTHAVELWDLHIAQMPEQGPGQEFWEFPR